MSIHGPLPLLLSLFYSHAGRWNLAGLALQDWDSLRIWFHRIGSSFLPSFGPTANPRPPIGRRHSFPRYTQPQHLGLPGAKRLMIRERPRSGIPTRFWHPSLLRRRNIGVGMAHWIAPLLPPNRTGGFPASGSPVSILLLSGDWQIPASRPLPG